MNNLKTKVNTVGDISVVMSENSYNIIGTVTIDRVPIGSSGSITITLPIDLSGSSVSELNTKNSVSCSFWGSGAGFLISHWIKSKNTITFDVRNVGDVATAPPINFNVFGFIF